MPVIDTSVYVALINAHEQNHRVCWSWFERVRSRHGVIVAPVILLAEVAAAISRGVGNPGLAQRVVQPLLGSNIVGLVPVSTPLARRASVIAADHRIRGCDAVYVAWPNSFTTSW